MRENTERKSPTDWLPMYFDDKGNVDNGPSEEEISEIQKEMETYNANLKKNNE
jgi:hypothetical protein